MLDPFVILEIVGIIVGTAVGACCCVDAYKVVCAPLCREINDALEMMALAREIREAIEIRNLQPVQQIMHRNRIVPLATNIHRIIIYNPHLETEYGILLGTLIE